MSSPLIKCCGITNTEHGKYALTRGADALGLVFVNTSSRHVSLEQAKNITTEVLPLGKQVVGVFADMPVEQVAKTVQQVGLTGIQLHGKETVEYCIRLKELVAQETAGPWPFLTKAFSMRNSSSFNSILKYHAHVDAILLDTYSASALGGTGSTFDWGLACQYVKHWPRQPLIIAGGLNSNNVTSLLSQITPLGVDVSSGIETAPGIKDKTKIDSFIKAVKGKRFNERSGI